MKEKLLKRLIFGYLFVICIIVILLIFAPYMYGANSKGKVVNDEKIYDIAHGIISQKYAAILYDEYDNLYDIFSFLSKSKLENFYKSNNYVEIFNNFKDFKILNIEKTNINKYIIYYNEVYDTNDSKECKMIIKYKNNKAIVFYDTLLEENNG